MVTKIFDRLFGKRPELRPPDLAQKEGDLIQVYDAYGREMAVRRDVWRGQVLPDMLKTQWANADKLYPIIAQAVTDGFERDVMIAAQHLYELDGSNRAANIFAICLLKAGNLDSAEKILRRAISTNGEEGYLLTNLAKVFEAQKESGKAEETLWHALELDPNQDNGLLWYQARKRELGGENGEIEALSKVAALPESWRAQLWLARYKLNRNDLEGAKELYREAISHASKPLPAGLLTQMSGDLGNAGWLHDLVEIAMPHFQPSEHGLAVGNNLIKACVDLSQLDKAKAILNQLYRLDRPDYQKTLSFWDAEIAKSELRKVDDKHPLAMGMLKFDGPIWLTPGSEGTDIFPLAEESENTICFLGGTAEKGDPPEKAERQLADGPGRLSRAVPLFLAEQVAFHCNVNVTTLIPWVQGKGSGSFVLSAVPWADTDAIKYAQQSVPSAQYLVTTHIKAANEPWLAHLEVFRLTDGAKIAGLDCDFQSTQPGDELLRLGSETVRNILSDGLVSRRDVPPLYVVPTGRYFADYLVRLEQLLAIRCTGAEAAGSLNGERQIIDGNIQLCVDQPGNFTTRLLLAKALVAMKRIRPDIISEFEKKISLLSRDKPLPEPANGIVRRLLDEATSTYRPN